MTDSNSQAAPEQNQAPQPIFALRRAYIKDSSIELPNAPQIFTETAQHAVDVSLKTDAQRLSDVFFEASVTVTITSRIGEQVAFLVECTQAGIFEIANIPAEQLDPILGVLCPGMIYPYLRANVADLVTRTSFPPIHLWDINFEQHYQQQLEAAQVTQAPQAEVPPVTH